MKARQSNPPDATLIRTAEAIDLTKIIEVYGASVRTLAAPYYSAEQLAAWALAAPDFERWRQRL
ncbi:MAG TPA: hypothetical protein DCE44_12240, partial [Verrucomicrobiales bacterium]|nr:hypothetical protein [Verrucomicrobiales bacterium]